MIEADVYYLGMTARLALRGHGGAEPNPMVGCVIVQPSSNEIVGWGYHLQCGGPHAEAVALERAGKAARGATLYCTLEPCDHTGRTPPCTEAIISAKIARVVIARRDPHELAAGGMKTLRAAGIQVELNDECLRAIAVSDPFVHRVKTGLPWVTAKWAQTIDGKIATRDGESKWISNEASRKLVHRERGRVDAILTGIGTIVKDDPLLTARGVRVRRIARRIVIDPKLDVPMTARVVSTARDISTTIVCDESIVNAKGEKAQLLQSSGVEVLGFAGRACELPLDAVLRDLVKRHEISTILVEAGSGLLSRLFTQKLVNEAWVFIAPLLLGDDQGQAAVKEFDTEALAKAKRMELMSLRRRGGDIVAHYRCK